MFLHFVPSQAWAFASDCILPRGSDALSRCLHGQREQEFGEIDTMMPEPH